MTKWAPDEVNRKVRELIDKAAKLIGSDYRNIGVLEAALDWLPKRLAELERENAALRRQVEGFAERIAKQSEILGRKAETAK